MWSYGSRLLHARYDLVSFKSALFSVAFIIERAFTYRLNCSTTASLSRVLLLPPTSSAQSNPLRIDKLFFKMKPHNGHVAHRQLFRGFLSFAIPMVISEVTFNILYFTPVACKLAFNSFFTVQLFFADVMMLKNILLS